MDCPVVGSNYSVNSMATENQTSTIRDLIDRMARAQPEAPFLLSPETGKPVTFRGLQERSRRLASELLGGGLEPGDKIAFLLDNGLFTAQLFLGVMYGGFVAVPLNVNAGVSQLSYTLDHSDAGVVYVDEKYVALIEEVLANVRRAVRVVSADVDGLPVACETPVPPSELRALGRGDPALLMYTSGSTGQPKAAVHSQGTVLACAENVVHAHDLSVADRSLLVLPLYHMNGGAVTLLPTLISGGSVVVPERFSVSQFWDLMEEHRCTWSALVPTIISQLLDWRDPRADSRRATFQRIRFLRSSSAPLSPSLHREFIDKFGLLLLQAMGSSEAGNVFSNPLPPGENKIGSPGLPTGFEVRVDRGGVEVPQGEPGEVLIRGAALTQGYYKDLEATAAVFDSDGWLHTGDLAYRDGDGYFFVIGRSKELIIKGGVNIAPRQIDEVLESHPAVLEAATIGVPDRYLGEDVVAFVVLRTGVLGDERDLLAFCEARLGHFKTPTRLHFVDDLPKGPSGKIQRLQLNEKAAQLVSGDSAPFHVEFETTNGNGHASYAPPPATSSLARVIAETWAEVLSQPHVDSDSNFFALGGHSLLAVQCVSLLRDRIPVALSLSDFFEHATVARQAALVTRRWHAVDQAGRQTFTDQRGVTLEEALQKASSSVSSSTIRPRDRTLPCPLSPGQRRLLFLDQLNPGSPAYNESDAYRLLGELNVDAMERALNVIVARHEVLRTTIQVNDAEPVAVVHESWPLQLKKIDLAALSPLARKEEVERLLVEEPRLPYHLGSDSGIRITLVCLGPREHVLILMMHHIIADWSTEGIFFRELASLYRSFTRGEPPALPPLTIQHGDYAAWQIERNQKTSFAEDLDFWEENLRGAPQLLELPADRTRPPILSYRGGRQRLFLNPDLTKALRDLAKRTETTLFILFAAALNTLFSRYTGKEDISLGIPIGERDRKELQSVMGFLLETHVLRTELSADMTFRELLARVQKGVLGLYLHRAVPFDQVVSKLQPERNLNYTPLFQVMLIGRDPDQMLSFVGLEGLTVEPAFAPLGASKFDLTLFVTDCGENIWLEIEYSTDLFDASRIVRMLSHYQTLLEAAAADPDQRLFELPLLTDGERLQSLVEWNDTAAEYPRDVPLAQLVEEQVERTPGAMALIFENGSSLSYRSMNDQANQLAHELQKQGAGPDQLVGMCMDRSLHMVIALLAIVKAGAAYVPLDPELPAARLAQMIEDSGLKILLTQRSLRSSLPPFAGTIVEIDGGEWQGNSIENPDAQVTPENLAYVIYTSGSTGRPKGVEISRGALINFLWCMRHWLQLKGSDALLAVTTISFDIAGMEVWLPLLVGARCVIASRSSAVDGQRLREMIDRWQVTCLQATPVTWQLLLAAGWRGKPDLQAVCGGEAMPLELAAQMRPLVGRLWNLYGPTETTIWSTGCPVEKSDEPVLIGRPVANTQCYILDERRQPMPIGVVGELYIAGDGLARGYRNRQELTEEKFVRNPFVLGRRMYRTGDLARFRADGNIECLGRADHQVKLRGFRIELGEIESVLKQLPGIDQCVVLAREDHPGEKRLVAYLVAVGSHRAPDAAELREFLKQNLPDYMVPSVFAILDRFPLTPNGKIDRKALLEAQCLPSEPQLERPSVSPGTLLDVHLLKIWERVLAVGNIGMQENFFALGGHSLLAARLIGEINKALNVSLTFQVFFTNPTIAGIAKALRQGDYTTARPHLIPLRPAQSQGAIFFIDASMAMCRLANILDVGPPSFATEVPLPSAAYDAALLNKKSSLPRIEDLAAAHSTLIRSQRLTGPCLLAGHSFGGLLAFEVAHQLRREGTDVEMVLLVDSWAMSPALWHRIQLLSWARARLALNRRRERLAQNVIELSLRMFRGSKSRDAHDSTLDQSDKPFNELPFEVRNKIYRNARKHYRLRRLESRAVLFRSHDRRLGPLLASDNTVGWKDLFAGGFEIVETPGDHLSLLQEPHVLALAHRVNECLAKYSTSETDKLADPTDRRLLASSARSFAAPSL